MPRPGSGGRISKRLKINHFGISPRSRSGLCLSLLSTFATPSDGRGTVIEWSQSTLGLDARLFGRDMLLALFVLLSLAAQQPEIDPQAVEWFRKGESLIGTPEAYSPKQAGYFEKAVQIAPDFAAARYNLALIYLRQNQPARAVTQLDALLELEPSQPRGYLLRAEALLRAGELLRAQADVEKVPVFFFSLNASTLRLAPTLRCSGRRRFPASDTRSTAIADTSLQTPVAISASASIA